MNDRLYRSRSDRMLAGVAGGVADRFDLDPAVVRVLWAILILLSGGIFLLIYIVMAIVVPLEPIGGPGGSGWSAAGASSWSSAWPTSWPATNGPPPDQAGPPAASPATPGPDPAAAGPGNLGSTPTDPSAPGFAAPGFAAPPAGPGGAGPGGAGPGPSAPGFAAPPAGSWSPGSSWSDPSAQPSRHAAREARRAARRAGRGYGSDRSGAGGIIGGLILVALGAYFLVRTFAPQLEVDRYWPAGLVVLGLVLVGLSIRRTPGPGGP
jgi:phage shock protein C